MRPRSAPAGVPVVAADKGLEHALLLGLEVTLAVGDFDSASPEADRGGGSLGYPDRAPSAGEGRDRSRAGARRGDGARPAAHPRVGGRRRPARPSALDAAPPRLRALRGRADRRAGRLGMGARRPWLAGAGGRTRRARLAHSDRAGRGRYDGGARLPAAARDSGGGHEPRCVERVPGEAARITVEHGVLLAIRPEEPK